MGELVERTPAPRNGGVFGNMSERIHISRIYPEVEICRLSYVSETNTAVVNAGTVAAPVFELKVDSRVAASLEVCWSG
jgi:hypothetical protein